jgi:predicted ArsR family transcriptional regulator
MNWIERVLGSTRGQLLRLLRRSRSSINELAGGLGITDNAVRTHIAAMQRDGMVRSAGVERATGGKPAQLYEITPEAEEMFPKAYAVVLNSLLGLLEERQGRSEVVGLLREVGARAATAGSDLTHEEEEARVFGAAEVLRQLGGDVEVERTGGGWRIRGYGCPLSAVVAEHEETCSLAESLVAGITGLAARECCDRSERPRCSFAIHASAGLPS